MMAVGRQVFFKAIEYAFNWDNEKPEFITLQLGLGFFCAFIMFDEKLIESYNKAVLSLNEVEDVNDIRGRNYGNYSVINGQFKFICSTC